MPYLVFRLLAQDDLLRMKPDISMTSQQSGCSPKIALADDIRETVKYFRHVLNAV